MHRQPAAVLMAGLFSAWVLLMPGLAQALGLGQIESETHIGQNLAARIPILAAGTDVLQGLKVGLAKPEAYRRAGIRENDFLFNLKFQVEQGAHGPYVLIRSNQPVRLPFLNILVHAHWSSGDITRQYTLLLNPPVFASTRTAKARSNAPVTRRPASVDKRGSELARERYSTRQPTPANQSRPGVYGPVRRGQTLWSIANSLRSGATANQMMIALYRANPQAFSGNINRLKAGATLSVPSREDVERISRATANAEVAKQVGSWKSAKSRGKDPVAKAAVPADPSANPAGGTGPLDEFDRRLGELSTMMESYMPAGGERSAEPRLPSAETEPPESEEDGATDEAVDRRSRFELARAYLDMEDRESARAALEGLLDEGDATERAQARRMLDAVDGEPGSGLPEWSGVVFEEGEASLTANEASLETDESGTAMDLARAYLELGDRESARDILAEILDGGDEERREKARELLVTFN